MNKKKFQQEKNNQNFCMICGKLIYFKIDDYCHLEDFRGLNKVGDGWYHLKCWNDKLKSSTELDTMKKKAMKLLDAAGKMVGMKDEEPMEVIRI